MWPLPMKLAAHLKPVVANIGKYLGKYPFRSCWGRYNQYNFSGEEFGKNVPKALKLYIFWPRIIPTLGLCCVGDFGVGVGA